MISKLLIVDVNVSDEVKSLLEVLKEDSVLITYYDYSEGFVVNNQNLLVDKLLALIHSHLETTTVNFQHLCFMNVEQMKTPMHSFKYNNQTHVISGIESKPEKLESWNFMGKLVADIAKTTEIRNIDFIDIDHLYFPKEHALIFDKIQEVTKDVEERAINYLKVAEDDKETIYNSENWLHTMFTTFYSDENKVLIDKYFKVNNSNIGFLNTKTMKPRNLKIYHSHVPNIDFESDAELNVSIIPLHGYENETDYNLMGDFVEFLNNNTIVEFVYITDTMEDFTDRLNDTLTKHCGENKDKINKVNVGFWLNPNISNPALMLSNHISANIDQELLEVVNQLMTNNTENVDQLKNHFIVNTSEAFIDIFNMNVYDNMDVNTINFEIFNISDTFNTNYNLLCQFLHNDYFISTLVNFNLTFLSYADNTENLFELHNKIEEFDEHGIVIDVSYNLFKDSQLITDISNNEAYQDDMFITNMSHINKSIQYNNNVNMSVYLKNDGPEIDKFMKQNIITNVILYDKELQEYLSDVRGCLLPNTLLLTFDKQNTYQDIKDGLLRINELNGVQISNVALFQDNKSMSKTYNLVNEESSIIKYPRFDDPSLNSWSKFQDFVTFLDSELGVKYFDLLMCKIYINPNWKYVIDYVSSNLTSLEIRSSQNNTGHTMFEGDWILESPLVDVNMIHLYFKESIKELEIQLGDMGENGEKYFNKIKMERTTYVSANHKMNVKEIQVFIYGKNVALNTNGGVATASSFLNNSDNFAAHRINDGHGSVYDGLMWHSSTTDVGEYITIELAQPYLVWDIEAVVVYHRENSHSGGVNRQEGCRLALFNDNELVSTVANFSALPLRTYYRFDGYSIGNVSTFATNWSGYQIVRSNATIGLTYVPYSGSSRTFPTAPEGYFYPKLTDSDANDISYVAQYTDNGKQYVSYAWSSNATINIDYDLRKADFMILAGGGAGQGGRWGGGGGGGGIVIGREIDIVAGEYNIVVGAGGTATSNQNTSSPGENSEAFGYVALGGGGGGNSENSDYADGGSGGGFGNALGFHSDTGTFVITGGSANYNNDSSNYPNVLVHGYPGGTVNIQAAPGGGSGQAVGGNTHNSDGRSFNGSGHGAVGMKNNFYDGVDFRYGAGGGGGHGDINGNEGQGGGGGYGDSWNTGGGGDGGLVNHNQNFNSEGQDATPNTGSGGGGASTSGKNRSGGDGSNGMIILRFALDDNEHLPQAAAVASDVADYSTKFYNYNTGEALVATEEQIVIGSYEPKILDSNGDELAYNTYTENSIEYKSYVFTSVGTTSVSLSHDTPVDFMVVAGGGGGGNGAAGGGGVVVGTEYMLGSGNYNITVGNGGHSGPLSDAEITEVYYGDNILINSPPTGSTANYLGHVAVGGNWYESVVRGSGMNGEDSSIEGGNVSFKALKGAGGTNVYIRNSGGSTSGALQKVLTINSEYPRGYDDSGNLFDIIGGQANYGDDAVKYPNVIIYGNQGGTELRDLGWTNAGGGGAGSVGRDATGTVPANTRKDAVGGKGGDGLANTFADGTTQYYGAGGPGYVYDPMGTDGVAGLGGVAVGVDAPANTGAGASSNGDGGSGAGGSGIVVIRFPKIVNEYETKKINVFTESTTAYLNYDISVAEIKEYIAPDTTVNTYGDISNVPEDFVFSTTQNVGTFTHGTTISITDTLAAADDPNNNKSYTFTLSSNSVITELNFTPTNYSGDYTSLYYVIQENTNSILKKSDDTLQDENFIESQVDFSNGTQDLLQVGDTKVIIENKTNQNKDYVLLFYTLEGTASVLLDSGKLNRYLYDGYGGTEYTNIIPAWTNFSNYNSSALVTNTNIPNHGDHYNYLYDGYVYYTETTTKHFGTTGDDDTFVWVVEGDKKWSTVGHPHRASYSWIASNIPNATLVCYRSGRGGPNSTYTGSMVGSYTFQANTLYTILMKFTEHTGGINFSFGISNSSLNNQTRRTTTFPSQFHATFGLGGIAEGSSIEYSITSASISEPVVEDVSSQIVSLDAGVYNIVVDKPVISEPISTDDLQMEYIVSSEYISNNAWTSVYTSDTDGTAFAGGVSTIPGSWISGSDGDGDYYQIAGSQEMEMPYPNETSYVLNMDDVNVTTTAGGLTYEVWVKVNGSINGDAWIIGLETGWGPCLVLNDNDGARVSGMSLGGIGMTPYASDKNTYNGLTSPGYITSQQYLGNLVHVVGYMYRDPAYPTTADNATPFLRGVYVNGTHYPQTSTQTENQTNLPLLDEIGSDINLRIGHNTTNSAATNSNGVQIYSFRVWHRQLTETEITNIYKLGPYGSVISQPTAASDISENIVVDLSTNTITSNVDFEIKYTPVDVSLSELTNDLSINPVRSQTIPFVKSNGNQEERSVTLHGDATYNRFTNEYYFPGDLSGYASIEGQLFGEHAMSMSFMYKSGGEQPVLETDDASMARNTITYIGHPYPSPLNQNAHDTNDFAIYSSPNDQASIFYKEDDTSIKEVSSSTFDNSSNYTHIAITMNEDLTLNETNGFKLYVDGTLTKSGNLSANNGALISGVAQPLQLLGKGPLAGSSQSSAFKGYLKNVRFYDHVLSQSEVSTIYTNMITNEYTDNKNFVSQVVPNVVISSSDISSGDHTELTSISMEITSNETITKKEDPNEVVVSPTFKYVVLQRNSAPQTYQANLVPEQVSLTEIVEIECFVNSNNVLLSSNGTNAIWSRDFVVNNNVANVWSDAGESVRYWSWALSRVPNNAINGNSTRGDDSEMAWAHHDDALNPPTNAIHWIATLASEQSLDQVDYVKLYNGSSQLGVHSEQGDLGYRIAGTRFLFLNDAREVVAYTGEITTGVYEHTFNAADITTVSPEVITVENPSLTISQDDINVVNGVISDFKNSSQNSMSFTFTPASSNIKSSISISENSVLNKTVENMTDKPSWFTNYRNNASNIFEFMRTDVEMDLMPPIQDQTIAMITSTGSHLEIPVTLNGHTTTTSEQSIPSITTNNTVVNIPDATSLDSIDISEGYVQGTSQTTPGFTGVYKVPGEYKWIVYYTVGNQKMVLVEAVEVNGSIGIKTVGQGYVPTSSNPEIDLTSYNNRTSVTSEQYGLENIVVKVANTVFAVTYDASKNEYDITENGYLSIDEDVIRDGDLTISLMYAMRSGNQYGNDQLVNFSDTNSLNTSTDSTDIHIFRDGTTPGAWFYYGSPDDNGMAISEAGLEPSLVNTQVTQQGEFDTTDLQMEYIANTTATESTWTSVYTNNSGNATTHATNVPSEWVLDSDTDGDYYLIQNHKPFIPSYPNKSYLHNADTTNLGGVTYECWTKLPSGTTLPGRGWLIGIETGWGPYITLNDTRVGGVGMPPGTGDGNTYTGLTNPGYISSYENQLVHLVGYVYKSNSGQFFHRGIWINGVHYPQETTQQAPWTNTDGTGADYPRFDSNVDVWNFAIGNRSNVTDAANAATGMRVYSFRNWHRQLTGDEVAKLYSWGPQGSVITPPEVTTGGLIPEYTHMAITVKEGQVKRFYINGEVVDYVNKYRSNAIPVSRPIVGGKRQYQLFGYGYAANRGFSGLMKNIRIYNKALTAYEVRHLYAINSNFNDNDFSNTILIPVSRPTLTFSSLDISSGSSLEQSTLDLTLTASDDGLDGNISASDIITSNGTITAFSQTSPTTWDLTYTSDYNKQSNVGSLFIEQDTIYNNDVSDIMVPQIETQNFGNSSKTTILNSNYNIIGTPSFGWPVLGSYGVGETNAGGIAGGPIYANPAVGSEPHYVCIFDSTGGMIKYSYFNIANGVYSHKFRGWKDGFDDSTDYFQNYIDNLTTNQLTEIFAGSGLNNYDSTTNYVLAVIQSITSQTQPEPWWTREHNEASNRFEWTALNSGASDTSITPTRPSVTFSSPDLNHGESQNLGTISMTIYVSSNNLNIEQTDLSFSNGVVSDFTKVANNYYTFNFKSASVSQPSIIEILQDTVSNAETSNDFNEASNTFEWTWGFTVTAPDVTITSSDVTHGGNFGGQQVNMILEFSSEVLHGNSVESTFSQFDVSATNGYVFDVSIISQSQIAFKLGSSSITESTSVFIPQNIISRTFNDIYTVNSNNTSNVFTWSYDSADLTISSLVVNDANGNTISAGDNINGNELWLQFTFSESIYNFDKSYFNVTNCKITNISTDTTFTTFTIKIETYFPTSAIIELQSDKLITTGRGLQKYITGSSNLSFSWNYDDTRPRISMTSSQASGLTNNASFVDLSFVSTIDTSDFTESSIVVTGDASLSNFTAISASEYSVRVTPNSVTSINITVPENAYTEQYGNGNENSVSFNWNYDNIPPTVEIFSPDIANGASSSDPYINIYFTISKPVDDFVLSDDANVANGTLGAMTKTNTFVNHTTSFNVTVTSKTASHPYNGTGSSAGYFLNGVESPTIDFIVGQTYTFDQSDSTNTTHPLKFYTTAEKDQIYTSGVVYTDNTGTSGAITTITIDENTPSPLYYQCLNHGYMGFKGQVSKKESYTAKLYPTQNDTVSIFIFADSITDSAGNTNVSDSNEFDWIFDSNDLLTTLSSSDVTNNGTFANDSITISLATTAAIVDFVEADISYQNGTISNVDATAKTFTITSNAQGVPTTAFIIGGAVETSLGEPNIESNLFTWTYNPPIPKLVITSSQINEGDYTNISSIDFILTFDQAAVVFDQNSLVISNGTIAAFTGSGTTYQVTVTPSVNEGIIMLTLPEGGAVVVDNGNHTNDISYNFEWNYDSILPVITIGSSNLDDGDVTNLTGLNLSVTSTEVIEDLRLSDFVVSNAVISNLNDTSGTSFSMTIQPLDDAIDCSINIFLNDDSVTDRAGNANSQSNTFAFSYEFFSRKEDSSAIERLFENDTDIPDNEKLSSSEIDLVISAAFTIPDTASPFAVAATENSNAGGNNTSNDNNTSTTRNPTFVKPPKITIPAAIKIKNRKVFTKLIDQIFATASESVKTLTIDKSAIAVAAAAEEQIADVEEVVMVKSNQTDAVDMSTLIEDPTKPSATYIPLANVDDFAIVAIDGVEYTTVVDGEGIFALSSNDGGVIANPGNVDGKWRTNDVYQATDINKIIFGSQIISTDPVAPEPPTLTITSGQVSNGGTTDISYIDLSFVFSTTVEISLNSIEPLNADTTIISRTIESVDSSNSYISVTAAPVDASVNNTIGVFVDVSAFYDTDNTFNDVQYTYSWNYSLDGGGSGNGEFVPCFLEGTRILTTNGYKNIELLVPKKDKLLDKDNKSLNFLDIQKYSQENNGKQYPYKIPSGSKLSAEYMCNRDLYLTYNHCVYLPHLNKYAPVSAMKHLKEDKTLTQKKFTYYHIFTENYFSDTIMANGIPCESHSKYTFEKLRNIDPSCKLLKNVIKKAEMLPNCMRNRLSIKETKQIIKKFQSKQNKKKTKQVKKKQIKKK